ncbi:MAG: hypothetical protein GQ532_01890 [Methylomarinum sp.]|nr:hypothetical protein [Methylomarinum sp.]
MKPIKKSKIASTLGFLVSTGLTTTVLAAGIAGHPGTQPRPGPSMQTVSEDGSTTFVVTPEGHFDAVNPFDNPPGSNFLPTVNSNMFDFNGDEMPNTQPSAYGIGDSRYLLHDGPVVKESINIASPSDDLDKVIDMLEVSEGYKNWMDKDLLQMGIDILEGNPIPDRAYSGMPMLHYNGPNKVKTVIPSCAEHNPCQEGDTVTGGNIDVEMIYFDQRIESDTAFVDPSAVQDVPWTITYHVNILHNGMEDFSPMVMYFDQKPDGSRGPFHVSMDQSYFPMLDEGNRYSVKIKETLGKYYNLTYTWGWRIHPPRVQVIENATTVAGGRTLVQWESDVFGLNPRLNEETKLAAIAKIGDIAPAKRMWNIMTMILHDINQKGRNKHFDMDQLNQMIKDLRVSYLDWMDRTKLPTGVAADPDATITLLYANNTIYGSRQGLQGEGSGQGPASYKGICNGCAHDWTLRPYNYKATLLNGDNFPHAYMNVDFGGSRGWENQYQETDPTTALAAHEHTEQTVIVGSETTIIDDVLLDTTPNPGKQDLAIDQSTGEYIVTNDTILPMNTGGMEEFLQPSPRDPDINAAPQLGSGCFFTFGRFHAWPNAGGPWGMIMVPPVADDGTLSTHKVDITYNFEPSRRLRIYQFDPLHHDVAVYSLH